MTRRIAFDELNTADLERGAILDGGLDGTLAGEPLQKAFRAGNQGGIRINGPEIRPHLVVLVSTLAHPNWPDQINDATGTVAYHGDNDATGSDLLDHRGNRMLQHLFARGLSTEKDRATAPPFFVFSSAKDPGLPARSHRFHGVAVPGRADVAEEDWLVAKWFQSAGGRFQNFVLTLTILDVPVVSRAWLDDLLTGGDVTDLAPPAYLDWIAAGL